ncbi:MAG: DUF6017 domain-containing protein [Bacteroidales bacterium]|nr:DUF6017 domain-containing protein [Bacteroidales bacterium]
MASTGDAISFKYYYGLEAEQYNFYRIPKILITDPHFKALSTDAKLLYGLMLDRMSLSYKSGWMDEENRVYVYYTLNEVEEQLGCKTDKAVKLFAELDAEKGIGLIERIRQGQGKPAKIYVKRFVLDAEVKSSEKPKSRHRENRSQGPGKTEMQTSEKSRSRLRKNRSTDFDFSERNNTEINNTDLNETDLSIHPAHNADDVMDVDELREEVKKNIEYDALVTQYEREDLDGLIELILETLCRPGKTIRISGAEFPASLVKDRFRKIGQFQVEYVMECMRNNTTKVYNIKAYLLAALYNASTTIGPYYQAEVNHDFYGK